MGGVDAIKDITGIPPSERTPQQSRYLSACLTALAHQPKRWYSYQDWGLGGPVEFLAARGMEFMPVANPSPVGQSWYDGCECDEPHWREMQQKRVQLSGSATLGPITATATLRVARAADVEIEDSPTLKFLRLRNGDFDMYKRVFLVIDGESHEITMDPQDVPLEQ